MLLIPKKYILILIALLLVKPAPAEESQLTFAAKDKSFSITTSEDYQVTFNPHAVLSLANTDNWAIVVTKHLADRSIEDIYNNFAKTIPRSSPCRGRIMMAVDGLPAAAFVIEGIFPPDGEISHQTLMVITIYGGQEYNFMLHYPIEREQIGLEDAYAMMATVKWVKPKEASPQNLNG